MRVHVPHEENEAVAQGEEATHGANRHDTWYVQLVAPVGAAAAADVRPGDQITGWGGKPMPADPEAFDEWVTGTKAGEKITLDILRGDKAIRLELRAQAPEPWIMEAWLMEYVKNHYPEKAYMDYRASVMARRQK